MIIATLPQIKSYLRIDYNDDDELIELMANAAEDYLADATGIDKKSLAQSQNKRAALFVIILTGDWYSNRELFREKATSEKVSHTLKSILLQLKLEI